MKEAPLVEPLVALEAAQLLVVLLQIAEPAVELVAQLVVQRAVAVLFVANTVYVPLSVGVEL